VAALTFPEAPRQIAKNLATTSARRILRQVIRLTSLAIGVGALVVGGVAAAASSSPPVQHGAAQGAQVTVFAPATAIFDLRRIERAPRRLITGPHGLIFGCLKVRLRAGIWSAGESMQTSPFKTQLRFVSSDVGPAPYEAAPYDGCEIGGLYGHRWDDAFGTRAAIEIWLTARGRHFFNDRAAARDLAYFVRSERVHKLRISANPHVGLQWFVSRYPGRVVELARPAARVPKDVIGFWIGARTIVFTATSSTHRRFFVIAKRGSFKLPEKNLGDLAFVF
jgi:hypothetical protein